MAFLPPVLGYLVEKGLQKGGSWAPQDPPGYALEWPAWIIIVIQGNLHQTVTLYGKKTAYLYPSLRLDNYIKDLLAYRLRSYLMEEC